MLSLTKNLQHLGSRKSVVCISFASGYASEVQKPPSMENIPEPRVSSAQSAQFRRGAGGRSSFSGSVITVFGSTGRLGSAVVNHLAKHGHQLIIPYRCDPYWVREQKVLGDLGQVLFFPINLRDEAAIRKAVKYSNVVINLIGTTMDTKNFSQHDTNVDGARTIAKVSKEMGVERLVHVSAMNANPDYQPRFYKQANFLKTKGLGELAVREEFPNATIIRPGTVYGHFDTFLYRFLQVYRMNLLTHGVYLYKKGEDTFKMPILDHDVSVGIAKAATDLTALGKTYEFVGPHCYKLSELVDFMYAKGNFIKGLRYNYHRTGHFDPWFWTIKKFSQLRGKIFRSNNRIDMEFIEFNEAASDILTGASTLADLGVSRLAEFEIMGGHWAYFFRGVPDYYDKFGEFDEPPLPLRVPPLYADKLGEKRSNLLHDLHRSGSKSWLGELPFVSSMFKR